MGDYNSMEKAKGLVTIPTDLDVVPETLFAGAVESGCHPRLRRNGFPGGA